MARSCVAITLTLFSNATFNTPEICTPHNVHLTIGSGKVTAVWWYKRYIVSWISLNTIVLVLS